MSNLKIHHIGYLVKKMEQAKKTFESLGYQVEQDSVVAGLIKKYKNTPYHICYETDDYEAAFAKLRADGFLPTESLTPTPAPALGGRSVIFLVSAAIGMIELIAD